MARKYSKGSQKKVEKVMRERNAGKILSEERRKLIRNKLLEAISRFDPAP